MLKLSVSDMQGAMPAIITPMKEENGEIKVDFNGFEKLVQSHLEEGVTGIVIGGTTGQSSTIDESELLELSKIASRLIRSWNSIHNKPVKVIVSTGSNNTQKSARLSEKIASEVDIDGLLHVTGYYNNPPQDGLLRHFSLMGDIAAKHNLGVVLYNVPSRTNSNIAAETTIELSRHPAIVAVKEASGDMAQIREILAKTDRQNFAVFSGEDHLVAEIIEAGGTGVISATANVWPGEFQRLTELARDGEHSKARELQFALQPCIDATFSVKNPIPLHYMLNDSALRLPLIRLGEIRESLRIPALEKINKALAINEFPHKGAYTRPLSKSSVS